MYDGANMRITNVAQANDFLKRDYRAGLGRAVRENIVAGRLRAALAFVGVVASFKNWRILDETHFQVVLRRC